jgi:hypothetical protein
MKRTFAASIFAVLIGCIYYFSITVRVHRSTNEPALASSPITESKRIVGANLLPGSIGVSPDPLASIRHRSSFEQARIDLQLRGLNISAGRSLRQLEDDADFLGDPRATGKLLLWRVYCMSTPLMYQETQNIPSMFPFPLRVSDKVAKAQLRMLNDEDVEKRFGKDYQAIRDYWERTLAPDEKFRAASLDAESKVYRQALISNGVSDCEGFGDKTRQKKQQERIRLLLESNTEIGALQRARPLPDELREDAREKAIQAILASRDLTALEFMALTEGHYRRIERITFESETDFFQPINMVIGRETLVLALCGLGIDCSPESYWSRTACLDYGACAGETLAERWRNALRRDGLPEDLFDKEAEVARDAIVRGDYDALGLRRRKSAS